jgi:hypothetical protein
LVPLHGFDHAHPNDAGHPDVVEGGLCLDKGNLFLGEAAF